MLVGTDHLCILCLYLLCYHCSTVHLYFMCTIAVDLLYVERGNLFEYILFSHLECGILPRMIM